MGQDDNGHGPGRSFLDRLGYVLWGAPEDRDALRETLRDAQERGLIGSDALDMIEGVFQVAEMRVRDIMVPRAQMDVIDREESPEGYLPRVIETGHSRFPVIDGDKDKVVGILLAKDLLRYFHNEQRASFNVYDLLRPAVFVPESKRLDVLLRDFRSSRNHMAIVVDEYGGVAGLVTIEDVLEQIVGDIEDEHDLDADDVMITQRSEREFVAKALTPIKEFNEYFGTHYDDEEVDTIGGLVMTTLGRVPKRGERLEIGGLRLEVMRADSRRIHLLKVIPIAEESQVAG
ncbi:HlyC/CorC family transporter [Acidiferrobacter sp.]|uniref:HlyC/CorC family transporter n=1 Tax=Acidiferrobacter sp. TaxID=1872107 RepID=UPI00261E3665|nr:transporter associated domain-containing protein [Acidiferrobacter sp.]